MNIENLLNIGAQAFLSKLGGGGNDQQLSLQSITGALSGLLGGDKGQLDLSSLLSNLDGAGLAGLAQSWLGDGANSSISGGQITQLFSQDKLSSFASQLGLGQDQAVSGLEDAIPAIVDNASSGGKLLDSAGGVSGLMDMAKGLFGR